MATKKKPVLVRFQSNSYEKIKTLADLNTRSLSNMVEYMAEQYIKEYEEKNDSDLAKAKEKLDANYDEENVSSDNVIKLYINFQP